MERRGFLKFLAGMWAALLVLITGKKPVAAREICETCTLEGCVSGPVRIWVDDGCGNAGYIWCTYVVCNCYDYYGEFFYNCGNWSTLIC